MRPPRKFGAAKPTIIIKQGSGQSDNKILLAITALSLLVTPIVVAIISYNANRTSTDKDYVNIAVSIINSKEAKPESRQWALRVLSKLSPVPFSNDGSIFPKGTTVSTEAPAQIVRVPVLAPPHVLVKKSDKTSYDLIKPCPDINAPKNALDTDAMTALANRLLNEYRECSLKQQYAVTVIDILQDTGENPSMRLAKYPPAKSRPTPKSAKR